MVRAVPLLWFPVPLLWFAALPLPAVTYHQQVARILADHCQTCHRAGEATPMPLTSYSEVRPWAKAIKEAVAEPAHAALARRSRHRTFPQ